MSLSVVLATYNEEKNIGSCLASVQGLADEIIVVDGSSTDKTVELAETYGARVKVTTNKPIFHINKQIAIDMATKDWILQLDADERVTPELAREIKEVTSKSQKDPSIPPPKGGVAQDDSGVVNGYWIPRKNWFLGRYLMKGGIYPDYTMRLYKRGKGRLPQKSVHEQAVVEGETSYLKNPLIHLADTSLSRYLMRWRRYVNLIRDELRRENPGILVFLEYLFIKPIHWFSLTYIRHKGFMDSWQGFVFSFFSSLRFPVAYLKYIGIIKDKGSNV